MSGFYILKNAGTLEGIDGLLVSQEQRDILNGSSALEGELARSREPFDIAGKKWQNGELAFMTEEECAIIDAITSAKAQALIDGRPTRQLERDIVSGLTSLDALIGSSFVDSIPFTPLINDTIVNAINAYCQAETDLAKQSEAARIGTYLLSKMINISAINKEALYTIYFGQ